METEKKSGPVYKTVGLMMAVMLVGKVMGILRDRMQGAYFGPNTAEGIAFLQASSLPKNLLDIMFASVFSASFIPVFNTYLETKGKRAAFDLAALFISVTLALTVAFTLLCVVFAPAIYTVFLDGAALAPQTRDLGVTLLRVMFPLIILSGLAFSLTGILQSMGSFNIPAAMSVVSNGIILIYYFFFVDRFGVYGLCVAFLFGWASQFVIQIPFLIRQKFQFRFRFNLRDPGLRQIAALALPVMVASWVGPVNLLVNAKAAINLYGGEFGYYGIHYANNLYTIISGVFVLSVANVIFPQLSKQEAVGDGEGFSDTLRQTLRGLCFFLLPMTFGLMAVSRPLVSLVYESGLFNGVAVEKTAQALFWFSWGIVGYGLQIVLSRACYALRDGRTPLWSAVAAMLINAVLSFTLAPVLEIAGPALASSVSISVAAVIMLWVLMRRGAVVWTRAIGWDLLKMAVAAVFMYGLVVLGRNQLAAWLQDSWGARVLAAGVPAILGVAVYIGGCRLLKIEEASQLFKMLRGGLWTGKKY